MKNVSEGKKPYANCPPGSGKSIILAHIAKHAQLAGRRVLMLVPNMELCVNNYDELIEYEAQDVGIYSLKLGRLDLDNSIVVAMVTPKIVRAMNEGHVKPFEYVLIDECHRVTDDESSGYRQILALHKHARIMGVSGTPGDNPPFFNCKAYEIPIQTLVDEGFLSPLISIAPIIASADMSKVKRTSFGYESEGEAVAFKEAAPAIIKDMAQKIGKYNLKHCLVTTSRIDTARHLVDLWNDDSMRLLTGDTDSEEREEITEWIKEESDEVRIVCNVSMLNVGFNVRHLDAVFLARSMTVEALYQQTVCRAIRAYYNKEYGYIIDYGGNIAEFGAIGEQKESKRKKDKDPNIDYCPHCHEAHIKSEASKKTFYNKDGVRCYLCPECGSAIEWPEEARSGEADIKLRVSGDDIERAMFQPPEQWSNVVDVEYTYTLSKGGANMIVATYYTVKHIHGIKSYITSKTPPHILKRTIADRLKNPAVSPREWGKLVDELNDTEKTKKVLAVKAVPKKDNPKYSEVVAVLYK